MSRLRLVLGASCLVLGLVARPSGQGQVAPGAQQPPPGTGFIAGQVIDAATGRPIAEANVSLLRTSVVVGRGTLVGPTNIVTDGQGRYFFYGLPAGGYFVRADRPGYTTNLISPPAIELADGERLLDWRVKMLRVASIAGTVRDAAGDPVVGTQVIAFRRTIINGRVGVQPASREIKTDDRGAYRISALQPGDYVVCACLRDPNPIDPLLLNTLATEPLNLMALAARALTTGADVVSLDDTLKMYAPTFYPSSRVLANAAKLTLNAGEEKSGIDFSVELVRLTRVSGRIVGADTTVQLMSLIPAADADAGIELTRIPPMLVQPDGRFDFASVPPGQYRLLVYHRETGVKTGPVGAALNLAGARGATPPPPPVAIAGAGVTPPPMLWANELVTVGPNGVSGLVITLANPPTIGGRFQFVGISPQPSAQTLTRLVVVLQPLDAATGASFSAIGGSTAADGTFRVIGAIPGKYSIAPPANSPWGFKSASLGGVDITDLAFEVGGKDLSDLVITMSDTPLASLTVNVPGITPQTADDLSALLFPADRKYWTDPAAARRRFQAMPISSKGTARVQGLPAGEYLIALVTGLEALNWQEASRLDELSRRAQRVTVADGATQTVEVRR